MMTGKRRLLLPIDLHRIGRDRLQNVVDIASLMQQGVLGLLLEDLQLQQAADLSFTTEIALNSGREHNLLRARLAQRSERINAETRVLLAELATSRNVDLSFEEASGQRLQCALGHVGNPDVFFMPRGQWQSKEHSSRRPDQPVQRLLVLSPPNQEGQRVMLLTAVLLKAGQVTHVEIIGSNAKAVAELAAIAQPGQRLSSRHDIALTPANILQLIRRSPCDLMLISRDILECVPAADLSAALAVASAQILVASVHG